MRRRLSFLFTFKARRLLSFWDPGVLLVQAKRSEVLNAKSGRGSWSGWWNQHEHRVSFFFLSSSIEPVVESCLVAVFGPAGVASCPGSERISVSWSEVGPTSLSCSGFSFQLQHQPKSTRIGGEWRRKEMPTRQSNRRGQKKTRFDPDYGDCATIIRWLIVHTCPP